MDEIARLTPTFSGVSYERLDELGSIQWPCNDKAPEGTPVMHVDEFVRGKGRFVITEYVATEERTSRKYPLLLTTGRILSQYNVGAQTRRTKNVVWHGEDRIDILIDLAMHARENRLPAFARKPAPVQATYLAYCGTTGLEAIDYRITDRFLDPPSPSADDFYSEASIRLPRTYWCYQPPSVAPSQPVGPLPAGQAGTITFGCLNNFSKVNAGVVAAWGRIMSEVKDSRMILHCREGGHRHRVRKLFAQAGVEPHRVRLVPRAPGVDYFLLYDQIDIALDPFPYPGGTTTCDALWMGVPVVSLSGSTGVSRGGLSILSNVGHPELVAHEVDEYVRIATELAADRIRLAGLRATLRSRMQASPLMDAPKFARDFEAALRGMWRAWCASLAGT